MPPREIRELPSGLSAPMLKAGSRTPVFVANENESEVLHKRYVHRLSEVEFFAPEEPDTVETLRAKAEGILCCYKRFGLTLTEFANDADAEDKSQVFNLPVLSRRVSVKVRRLEPARFNFINEENVPVDDL